MCKLRTSLLSWHLTLACDDTGLLLLRKIKDTITKSAAHQNVLNKLESAIPIDHLESWRAEVVAWEEDANQPNPFESHVEGEYILSAMIIPIIWFSYIALTLAKTHLELAQDEAVEQAVGTTVSLHETVSSGVLIMLGLDLEEQQYTFLPFSFPFPFIFLHNSIIFYQDGK